MYARKIALSALLLVAGISVALACGPFFPWQLLDNRTETLKATPANSFAYEAMRLASEPRDRLKPVEFPYNSYGGPDERAAAFQKEEVAGLSPEQGAVVGQMRGAPDGDAAFAAGQALPVALRLYTAGAVDFHKGNFPPALSRFQDVIARPVRERRPRLIWAVYSIGRISARTGDAANAEKSFHLVRKLVQTGVPDPLGLAVASYGQEAKMHFDRANALLVGHPAPPAPKIEGAPASPDPDTRFAGYALPTDRADTYAHEMAAATALYAEQAAHQSDDGVQSLRLIAQNVLAAPERINAAITNPLVQRLLIAYALARIDDQSQQDALKPDAGAREPGVTANALLPMLVAAIEKKGIDHPASADRLAALAYRIGRYDLAARMADKSNSALAEWVKAKIALQKGDETAAAAHYAAASRAFPNHDASIEGDNATRLKGEGGTLALARGQYVDALNQLYPVASSYWGDVAHIAERVLTADELKTFVDDKTSAPADGKSTCATAGQSPNPAQQIRDLLARRLVREERFDDAFAYFCDDKTRDNAKAYAADLHEGDADWGRVDRAQGFYKAALLARESGMEIMGTETDPDQFYVGGAYGSAAGQIELKGPYIGAEEHRRFAGNAAKPNLRFHYRYIAADEASGAADLLPHRTQAFAAVLCHASGWMLDTQGAESRSRALYRRYVKEGARVPWAKTFGRKCPEPDFDSAIKRERLQMYHHTRHYVSVHRWWFVGGGLLAIAGALLAIFRRRIFGFRRDQ